MAKEGWSNQKRQMTGPQTSGETRLKPMVFRYVHVLRLFDEASLTLHRVKFGKSSAHHSSQGSSSSELRGPRPVLEGYRCAQPAGGGGYAYLERTGVWDSAGPEGSTRSNAASALTNEKVSVH